MRYFAKLEHARGKAAGPWRPARLAILLMAPCLFHATVWADSRTVTQVLSPAIQPEADVSVPATATLTRGGGPFEQYTGGLTVSYWARTTLTTGSATVTAVASGDFTPSGGPAVSAGDLVFACSSATLGTACSGAHSMSGTTATTVVSIPAGVCTGGGSPCSTAIPNSVQMDFILNNKPAYKTGTYTVRITFNVVSL